MAMAEGVQRVGISLSSQRGELGGSHAESRDWQGFRRRCRGQSGSGRARKVIRGQNRPLRPLSSISILD